MTRNGSLRVAVELKRINGRRAQPRFSVRQFNVLVDGRRQRYIIKRNLSAFLDRGATTWQARRRPGKPFRAGSRHLGSVELVYARRGRRGRTVIGTKRLSIPFFVCR